MEKAGACWREITENDGCYYRCEHKPNYEADINIPVRYSDSGSISNMRDVLEYMTKIEQKKRATNVRMQRSTRASIDRTPRSNSYLNLIRCSGRIHIVRQSQ